MGRRTRFKKEYAAMLLEYLSVEPYREVEREVLVKGEVVKIRKLEASEFPSLQGFAVKIGVHRDTLRNWCRQNAEFKEVYERAQDFHTHYLIVNGLKGLVSVPFGIFTAKNVLGWRDRTTVEHGGEIQNSVTVKPFDLNERLKQLKGEN